MPKIIKILMFNNEFPPLGGGTGTVNLEIFNIFQNYPNIKIDLISSSSGKKREIERFSNNIRIFKFPVGKKNIHHASNIELIKYAFKSVFAACKFHKKEKYDFTFVWSTVPAGLPAFILKKFKKVPYIVRVGGPDIPGFEIRYSFIYKIISPFIKYVWKNADQIIAKCKTEKEMIQAVYRKLNVKLIYNGIDTDKFKAAEKTPSLPIKIICPARLIKRKGQNTLIDAISILKKEDIKFEVELIGDGDEKEAYLKYAKLKDVSKEIIFSTYVPREKMPEKYQNSDIFVLPSYNEGMSNALLEAMACGLPVVVTDVGGTEELVDKDNGFIFKAGDRVALTNILRDIYKNKSEILILGKNSGIKAEKYTWQKIADEYLNLFNNIVK